VRALVLPAAVFVANGAGFPVLPRKHQVRGAGCGAGRGGALVLACALARASTLARALAR
jgi:hypothetical protein